jgi:hypothetical protein
MDVTSNDRFLSRDALAGVLTLTKECKCPECKKTFDVPDVHRWSYKRGYEKSPLFLCSWSCLRKYDMKHQRRPYRVSPTGRI